MRARSIAIILLMLSARPAHAQDVDAVVADEMARQKIPGVAVAIVKNGEVVKAQGYGLANVEHKVAVTPETIFQSGSVGKQFTAAAVMLLVEDGKIALSDPVTKYFAAAPKHWQKITVRHLLTHTSGIPDYTAGTIDFRRDYTEQEMAAFAFTLKSEFAPGARWNYSNTGYLLLGAIVRAASGQFYGDVLRDRVFTPLGMKTARIISEEDIVLNRAAGYQLVKGELKNQEWVAPSLNTTADGALYLSLNDMIAWDKGLRAKAVLKGESWRQVYEPVTLNSGKHFPYGFGWSVDQFAGQTVIRHGGAWQGFKTDIARYQGDDLTIIVLANLAQADPGKIGDRIAGALNPALKRPDLTRIDDPEPAIAARVTRLLADTAAGRLSRAEFAYVREGLFPDGIKRYAGLLEGAGALQRLDLLERVELGDDRIYTYEATFASKTLRVQLGLAPDDKISSFGLSVRR